jgi:hypothetical protein
MKCFYCIDVVFLVSRGFVLSRNRSAIDLDVIYTPLMLLLIVEPQ